MKNRPEKVNILGKEYKIIYCDKASDVDILGREALWGQIDRWTRTIRIYDNESPFSDLFGTLVHEILHGIVYELKLQIFKAECEDQVKNHNDLDVIANILADIFIRNGWVEVLDE